MCGHIHIYISSSHNNLQYQDKSARDSIYDVLIWLQTNKQQYGKNMTTEITAAWSRSKMS